MDKPCPGWGHGGQVAGHGKKKEQAGEINQEIVSAVTSKESAQASGLRACLPRAPCPSPCWLRSRRAPSLSLVRPTRSRTRRCRRYPRKSPLLRPHNLSACLGHSLLRPRRRSLKAQSGVVSPSGLPCFAPGWLVSISFRLPSLLTRRPPSPSFTRPSGSTRSRAPSFEMPASQLLSGRSSAPETPTPVD